MAVLALLMMTLSTGPSTIGLKHLPSNEVALLNASNALWIAGFGMLGPKGHALRWPSLVGLVLGFLGVGLLVWPRATATSGHVVWQIVVLSGCLSWSLGTILFRNSSLQIGPLATNAVIMILGGFGLLAAAAVNGDFPAWHWSARAALSLAYLAVFGSAIAYTSYAWLLRNAPTDRVATFAYVNPAIATILGWAVLGEALGPLQVVGTLVILLGVALVTMPTRAPSPERRLTSPASGRGGERSLLVVEDFHAAFRADRARGRPRDQADDDRCADRGPEAANGEARDDPRDQRHHPRVEHQQEHAERQHGERQRQDEDERSHESIHDAEQDGGDDELLRRFEMQAVEDLARHPQAQRRDGRA
jgi:drug/metabolite transporter (DMT)-like permease